MTYKKGDYVLKQSEYNNHYMIIYDNGIDTPKMVVHASCTKRLTEKEAEEAIELYLQMTSGVFDKIYEDDRKD